VPQEVSCLPGSWCTDACSQEHPPYPCARLSAYIGNLSIGTGNVIAMPSILPPAPSSSRQIGVHKQHFATRRGPAAAGRSSIVRVVVSLYCAAGTYMIGAGAHMPTRVRWLPGATHVSSCTGRSHAQTPARCADCMYMGCRQQHPSPAASTASTITTNSSSSSSSSTAAAQSSGTQLPFADRPQCSLANLAAATAAGPRQVPKRKGVSLQPLRV
jgi:hypothetical protein